MTPPATTSAPDGPLLVYFSSASQNTHRFVGRLGRRSARIPLRPGEEPLRVDEEYVLIVPTWRIGCKNAA